MTIEEQLRELSLRIIVAASRAGIIYMEGETVERMADEILALRAELTVAKDRSADYEADFRRVVNEECAPDEKHCSCVPHLRRQLAQRDAELEKAKDLIDEWKASAMLDDGAGDPDGIKPRHNEAQITAHREALRKIEEHHVALNAKIGRPESHSTTLNIIRALDAALGAEEKRG
jgi:hypothetical protein